MKLESENFSAQCGCVAEADEEYWGYHLILDCKECDSFKIKDANNIRVFVKTLIKEINMKAFGEPIIEHFGSHNLTVAGYSLMQLIETSSITGHFAERSGDAYLDIFSCKPYDINTAKAVIKRFFSPQKIKTTYLTRQA